MLTIGRDIYCDTRLIISKLETLFPDNPLGATDPDQRALQQLLSKWCIDGGIFRRASQLIPPEMPLLKDAKFKADREELTGRSWSTEDIENGRPEAITAMKEAFELLEEVLKDGREWILRGKTPSLADIEGKYTRHGAKLVVVSSFLTWIQPAVWPFHWVIGLKGALPKEFISATQFPKVFAWVERFSKAVDEAKKKSKKPTTLKGPEAIKHVLQANFAELEGQVEADPLKLTKGQEVEAWPLDSGFKHHDRGKLLSLTPHELVMACQAKSGEEIRIHYPRTNFRIKAVRGDEKVRL